MRRPVLRLATALLLGAGAVATAPLHAGAQTTSTTAAATTPTTAPAATPTTTAVATPTTAAVTTTVSTGATTSTTSTPVTIPVPSTTAAKEDSGGGIPWVPIVGVVAVLAVVAMIVVRSRRRAAARRQAAKWRHRAADATAEAGAVARVLSQGSAPTGQLAQQLLASLRTFEDLATSAPDESAAASADRARRALQTLGLAIDADHRLRRAQPAPDPERLTHSAESLQHAAGETDRALRGVYRGFTETV